MATASCMWHEKAAAGNIFRQSQIILHVCARTLTSGQEAERRLGGEKTKSRLWADCVGDRRVGSWDIIIFVSLLTLKRNLCSVIIIRLCWRSSRGCSKHRLAPAPCRLPPATRMCNMQQCGFLRCGFAGSHRCCWQLRSIFDFNDARISFNDVLSLNAMDEQVQWKTERFKIERREKLCEI